MAYVLLQDGIKDKVDIKSDAFVERTASIIHDAWISRNEWAKGGELGVPYDQLKDDVKQLDRNQILIAVELEMASK